MRALIRFTLKPDTLIWKVSFETSFGLHNETIVRVSTLAKTKITIKIQTKTSPYAFVLTLFYIRLLLNKQIMKSENN